MGKSNKYYRGIIYFDIDSSNTRRIRLSLEKLKYKLLIESNHRFGIIGMQRITEEQCEKAFVREINQY